VLSGFALCRNNVFSVVGNASSGALVTELPGSRTNRSVCWGTVFRDSSRMATVFAVSGSGAPATSSRNPNNVDTPTGSRAGSGNPTGTDPVSGPSSCPQLGRATGQPSSPAIVSVTARTTGELATDVPDTGTSHAPVSWARHNHRVDSGIQMSGRSSPSETTSDSATRLDSSTETWTW
jgi:hypothetical protein